MVKIGIIGTGEVGSALASLTRAPGLRDVHVGTIQRRNRRAAEKPQRALEIRPQDLDRSRDPRFAGRGKAVGVGASAEDGARTEAEGLDDVGAPANAAIHPYLGSTFDGRDDLRQRAQRRRNAIQLAAAMVRHGHRRRALVDGPERVVPGEDAFDDDRAAPAVAHPLRRLGA